MSFLNTDIVCFCQARKQKLLLIPSWKLIIFLSVIPECCWVVCAVSACWKHLWTASSLPLLDVIWSPARSQDPLWLPLAEQCEKKLMQGMDFPLARSCCAAQHRPTAWFVSRKPPGKLGKWNPAHQGRFAITSADSGQHPPPSPAVRDGSCWPGALLSTFRLVINHLSSDSALVCP